MLPTPHVALAIAQFAGAAALSLGLLALFGFDARIVLVSNLGAAVLLACAALFAVRRGRVTLSPRLRRLFPAMGVLLVPVAFSGWSTDHAEPLRWSPQLRAILACGLPYAILLALQTGNLVPALPPTASEHPSRGDGGRAFTYLVLAFVFLFLLVSLPARALFASFDDSVPAQASLLVSCLTAAYALYGIHFALTPSLQATRYGAALPLLGAVAAGLNVVLNLLLIPALGPLGSGVATLATFGLLAAATLGAAQRSAPIAFERGRIAKICAAGAIIYLAALRWPATHSWPWLYAYVAAVVVGFPVVLALSGFFRRSEHAALRRIIAAA